MSYVDQVSNPRIRALQDKLAESVSFSTQMLLSDIRIIAEENPEAAQQVREVRDIISQMLAYDEQRKAAERTSFSYVQLHDEKVGKKPYDFPMEDIRTLIEFCALPSNNTQAVDNYRKSIVLPAQALQRENIPTPMRQLQDFFRGHQMELRRISASDLGTKYGYTYEHDFGKAMELIKLLYAKPVESVSAGYFERIFQEPKHKKHVEALLRFGEVLSKISDDHVDLEPATKSYRFGVEHDLNAYIHQLVPALAPKTR